METCYRHPNRETGVSCSNCGRPICPDCMTPTPVGMRCPECAKQKTRVTRGAVPPGRYDAPATYVLIALNVAAYLVEIASGSGGLSPGNSSILFDFGLFGPYVAEGEWYRLLTSGFLHASIIHIGFNMFALYFLGRILEPGIGTARFVAVYLASLFAGSLGALLLDPNALTIGASGAVFGIFGATFVIARHRGIEGLAASIGVVLLLNLAITFGSREISIGGHLGGLVGGVLCALIVVAGERGMLGPRRMPIELLGMIAIAIVSVVIAIAIA
ncbi:MAG TPA: rhomboid family intramembrane serine protease [Solirubrobacterales bacterium]|nr:rhomboid family intramembrane serine protease [Solirubrobacterales bacterium]